MVNPSHRSRSSLSPPKITNFHDLKTRTCFQFDGVKTCFGDASERATHYSRSAKSTESWLCNHKMQLSKLLAVPTFLKCHSSTDLTRPAAYCTQRDPAKKQYHNPPPPPLPRFKFQTQNSKIDLSPSDIFKAASPRPSTHSYRTKKSRDFTPKTKNPKMFQINFHLTIPHCEKSVTFRLSALISMRVLQHMQALHNESSGLHLPAARWLANYVN